MTTRDRAWRRAQRARMIARTCRSNMMFRAWLRDVDRYWPDDRGRVLGFAARTRVPCSCFMCGHVRRHDGPTIQERRHMEVA